MRRGDREEKGERDGARERRKEGVRRDETEETWEWGEVGKGRDGGTDKNMWN